MTEPATFASDIQMARRFQVSVLISAPPDRALAIASAIAEEPGAGEAGQLMMFDGAAILDAVNRQRWHAAAPEDGSDLVIRDIHRLTRVEQTALMALLDTESQSGSRRIIAAAPPGLFDRVQEGTFMDELYYRLNVIHIVSDPWGEGAPRPSGPIIAG